MNILSNTSIKKLMQIFNDNIKNKSDKNHTHSQYLDKDTKIPGTLPDHTTSDIYKVLTTGNDGNITWDYSAGRRPGTGSTIREQYVAPATLLTPDETSEIFNTNVSYGVEFGTNSVNTYSATGNTAICTASHAEGRKCIAFGNYSHAEGEETRADSISSHAEGAGSLVCAKASHAEGNSSIISCTHNALWITAVNTTNKTITIALDDSHLLQPSAMLAVGKFIVSTQSTGLKYYKITAISSNVLTLNSVSGLSANMLAYIVSTNGNGSTSDSGGHAEGYCNHSAGLGIHIEGGYNKGIGQYSHIEGSNNIVFGRSVHVEGWNNDIGMIGGNNYIDYSHIEGSLNTLNSTNINSISDHIEGYSNTVSYTGKGSGNMVYNHIEGANNKIEVTTGTSMYININHVEGSNNVINRGTQQYSHVEGYGNTLYADYQHIQGKYAKIGTDTKDYMVIGSGTSNTVRANCFRVNTANGCYGLKAFNATGADYAEMFEWEDGNPNNEDRRGRFVTLNGDKIRLANSSDDFILGIVSGDPSVVGDVYDDQWNGMYLTDIYGKFIMEEVEIPEQYEMREDPQDSNVLHKVVLQPAHTEIRKKLNPDYDPNQTYIPRSERPEWDAIGMMGKLIVVDDGSCEVNKYCLPSVDGIATDSYKYFAEKTNYRVIKRIDENHVQVLVL